MRKESAGCTLCPRRCNAARSPDDPGVCQGGAHMKVARAALHQWEEPCISGYRGSGTVFFCGCPLHCCFCQNHSISSGEAGKEISVKRLSEIFLELQGRGAHNINLVTPTHYAAWIKKSLELAKPDLRIPVVYNSGGYESVTSLRMLEGLVDVYLPDLKFFSSQLSERYCGAPDYFSCASQALEEMFRQTGPIKFDENGLLTRGMLVRHLVLPKARQDSKKILEWLHGAFPKEEIALSLMSQYTPYKPTFPELGRRVSTFEYNDVLEKARALGFGGYMQQRSSAREEYTPPFDLQGV